ncbi:MAG: DUF2306 domain-containing protein [Asticcacaulis sp.]|uniref:DUF2306 domain-containing protein n=1 Tax=Asticcacaulis sp. TaxID=1872648 RepID=UPI003F7B6BD1
MTSSHPLQNSPASPFLTPSSPFLTYVGRIWYLTAAAGQAAFVWMILAHYGRRTLAGDYAGWNDKPLIKGYVAGDDAGNLLFALHVLLAAVITLGGLWQLIPAARRRWPALHRWNGRLFMLIACAMACSGLWLTWARHTWLSLISATAVSLNGALILLFVALTWRFAVRRDIARHQKWAMRAFLAVNGVWFLRVGIMGWALLSGGLGMTDSLSGPADAVLVFGAYLIPLGVLELWFLARSRQSRALNGAAGAVVLVMTAFMALGIAGAIAIMWGPYML